MITNYKNIKYTSLHRYDNSSLLPYIVTFSSPKALLFNFSQIYTPDSQTIKEGLLK